jgi:cell division protein FtsI/penicillin-binding protein 2
LQAAVVVMNPYDGRILAIASHDQGEGGENLCLKADFPAASVFKIVSTAAALESAELRPDSDLNFTGRKHTLYRRQLKSPAGRGASTTTLKEAFAHSNNPIFGKLGIYHLGHEVLSEYAGKFLFNRVIRFDLPVAMSTIDVPEDAFGLAEIASGFNKRTLISPVHAALLVAAIANNGVVMTPRLIERVLHHPDVIVYRSEPTMLAAAVHPETAEALRMLMQETMRTGTCRTLFRKLRRKRWFDRVEIGAKTGTINDATDRFKIDWLTAYALPEEKWRAICVAIVAVHGRLLGVRSQELGRLILGRHFAS